MSVDDARANQSASTRQLVRRPTAARRLPPLAIGIQRALSEKWPGETNEQRAERLGIAPSVLSKYVNGKREPEPERLREWADAHGLSRRHLGLDALAARTVPCPAVAPGERGAGKPLGDPLAEADWVLTELAARQGAPWTARQIAAAEAFALRESGRSAPGAWMAPARVRAFDALAARMRAMAAARSDVQRAPGPNARAMQAPLRELDGSEPALRFGRLCLADPGAVADAWSRVGRCAADPYLRRILWAPAIAAWEREAWPAVEPGTVVEAAPSAAPSEGDAPRAERPPWSRALCADWVRTCAPTLDTDEARQARRADLLACCWLLWPVRQGARPELAADADAELAVYRDDYPDVPEGRLPTGADAQRIRELLGES